MLGIYRHIAMSFSIEKSIAATITYALPVSSSRVHRHPIVVRRDPQQFELCFPVMEGLGYSSAFFGASEIPATERNIITNSHGRRLVTISESGHMR